MSDNMTSKCTPAYTNIRRTSFFKSIYDSIKNLQSSKRIYIRPSKHSMRKLTNKKFTAKLSKSIITKITKDILCTNFNRNLFLLCVFDT